MMIRDAAAARPRAMRPSLPKGMRKFLCPDKHSNRTTLAAQERPIVFSRLLFTILNLFDANGGRVSDRIAQRRQGISVVLKIFANRLGRFGLVRKHQTQTGAAHGESADS